MISFIIVTRNSEKTIGACLKSVLAQGCRKEVIAVDGKSSDRTVDIIRRHKARLLEDSGGRIASARNVGLKAAKGDYIAFVDSDVVLPKGWCRKALELLGKDVKRAGVGGPGISPEKSLVSDSLNLLLYGKSPRDELAVDSIATMDAMYRKSAIGSQLFDETLDTGEDPEFNQRLVKKGFGLLFSPKLRVHHHHPISLGGLVRKWFNYGTNYPRMCSRHREMRNGGFYMRMSYVPVLLAFSALSFFSPFLLAVPVLQMAGLYAYYLGRGLSAGLLGRAFAFAVVHSLKQLAQLLGTFIGLFRI